jgi:[ribosomal protein S5]-alanine N-acetyltransferase
MNTPMNAPMNMPINAPTPGRPVRLQTKRFLLRNMTPNDALERWISWLKDPEVMGPLNTPVRAYAADQLRSYIASGDNNKRYLIGIFDLATQMQIGFFRLEVDPFHRRALFHVVIGEKSWWGKGMVNEAREALLDEFFNNRGIEKVVGMPFARNFPAIFNYKAQGWHHEGTFRGHCISTSGGPRLDQYLFGLTKDDWRGIKKGNRTSRDREHNS